MFKTRGKKLLFDVQFFKFSQAHQKAFLKVYITGNLRIPWTTCCYILERKAGNYYVLL